FLRGFTCPVVLGYAHQRDQRDFVYRAITCYGGTFQSLRLSPDLVTLRVSPVSAPPPHNRLLGSGLCSSPFARRSYVCRGCFRFPRGTEMFQFPRFACHGLWIWPWTSGHYPTQVPPFGHPRIDACLRLPEAYRSLPRPSSLPGAKASTVRS